MTPFTTLQGRACVLAQDNIDTDQILPARFLRKPRDLARGQDYAAYLFHDLDVPGVTGASVLIGGANFGCGSSREGAVYALIDAGIRCVVSPSFGDIFAANAARNGLLTVALPDAPMIGGDVWVDLPSQRIGFADQSVQDFAIDPARKRQLLEGLDEIGLTLTHQRDIARFTAQDRAARAWAVPAS
jgi:3-isopropylmalate/(R)-2-methylmalate dehydratase small subunit